VSHKQSASGGRTPTLAVIGCGAIARNFHLPALAANAEQLKRLVLVDADLDRARALGAQFGVTDVARDFTEVLERIDGAIILTPHHTHHGIATACLNAGKPVLSEKPLAESSHDVRDLVALVRKTGTPIAVNNTRRLIPAARKIADLLAQGAIGEPLLLDFCEGDKFDWPLASGAMFGAAGHGRGVLMDVGAHVVDMACWWLGAKPGLTSYRDDAMGGSEADALLEAVHGRTRVSIRLSWLVKMRNTIRVRGQDGSIEAGVYDWNTISLETAGRRRKVNADSRIRTYTDLAGPLLDNFRAVVAGHALPLVSAEDVLPSIELIEECYAGRTRFEMPWESTTQKSLIGA
jgi:predicted dehydrogenase